MTTTMLQSRMQRSGMRALLAATTLFLALTALTLVSPPAGAADGCGTYSYGFAGTRLLNDGISDSAGPFPADIPAGTYTVTLVSHDHHDTQVDVATQLGEQYRVVLDSGYVSPASRDIPDEATTVTTTFVGQVIDASTTISVRHGGAPGINSVDVLCVGFTPEPSIDVEVEPSVEKPPVPPAALEQPPTPTPELAPSAETPPSITPKPNPEVVVPSVVEPEVKGIVETPPIARLAITGPGVESYVMIALGLAMILLGGLLVRQERRIS